MIIKSVGSISGTEAIPLIAEGWAEIEREGFGDRSLCFDWNAHAFYAVVDGQVVGVLVWKTTEYPRNQLWVSLGYVLPAFRKQGIYTRLWESLVCEAKSRGIRSISSATSVNNAVLQKVAAKQGRKATFITYEYEVELEAS